MQAKRARINEALRLVRLYWGYSQSQLSVELGLSQSLISEIESGRKSVTLDVMERYSNRLGIRLSQLMFFAEEVGEEPEAHRGKKFIAERLLKLLSKLAPAEAYDA